MLRAILPPVLLILAVPGAILGGVATPTEAAALGAIGALLMAGHRAGRNRRLILLAPRGTLRGRMLHEAALSTMTMTAMIFATILAAGMFSPVFIGLGGEERVAAILAQMPGGATGARWSLPWRSSSCSASFPISSRSR